MVDVCLRDVDDDGVEARKRTGDAELGGEVMLGGVCVANAWMDRAIG